MSDFSYIDEDEDDMCNNDTEHNIQKEIAYQLKRIADSLEKSNEGWSKEEIVEHCNICGKPEKKSICKECLAKNSE